MKKIIVTGFVEFGDCLFVCGYQKFKDSKEPFESVEITKSSIIQYCKGLYPELIESYYETDSIEMESNYGKELFLNEEEFFDTGIDYRIIQEYMKEKSVLENLQEEAKQSA